MDRLSRLAGAARMMKGWEKAERAVGELTAKLESDIADYREVRRALKYVCYSCAPCVRRLNSLPSSPDAGSSSTPSSNR